MSEHDIFVKSVNRNTLSKQVIEQIVQLLASGQVKPGDKLPPEMELMEKLGVSRPVLREALSSLETMGVITRKTRGGTYFNDKIGSEPFSVMLALSIDNLPAIIEARMALELGLVTIAAEKITDEQLEQLKETIDMIADSEDDNYGVYDKRFHKIIALSANNPVVEGMIFSLLITHEKMDRLIRTRDREITVEHHLAIYHALKKRDPYEAFAQMYRHLSFVREKLLSYEQQWLENTTVLTSDPM
ncbi:MULTISPECIES: FadR/GntR family transcriptional regulator [Geobacillus]|jgi:DNA-binding FadR family transcriptional regulator|uniref:FadR family transcriptional regulator n=1 Tax=Geobacillus zalihae TaxID=213419 RepID=A0A1V9CSJ7_9BACL|nr:MULTISPECIES: FadR/GntR family transcriptional regulator [Geobacillus]AGE21928.1 HTH-type transcriptional regulator [Geobacillus sp. GHH01]OQP17467.1 GntR family transcriptional regulator [Geobacillus zalihae]OQP24508.1 GntR family transcriptional regulator [Geobacillus zalihae]PTR48254.1 FadR family transcriptional regulator [Geobacillus thermodenitrificans]QNU18641.1 FadR family transcriptional regulator [Geobacillus zalihae]